MISVDACAGNPFSSSEPLNFWLWWAEVHRDSHVLFIYGAIAPVTRAPFPPNSNVLALPSGASLKVKEVIIEEQDIGRIRDQIQNTSVVDLSAFGAEAVLKVSGFRFSIGDVFGASSAKIKTYYGLDGVSALLGPAEDWPKIINSLESELGLPFRGAFAGHLGGFDDVEMPAWLEDPAPVACKVVAGPSNNAVMSISRRDPLLAVDLAAHVSTRASEETLLDRLLDLPAGQERVELEVPTSLVAYEVTLFDRASGARIHKESANLLTRVQLDMRVAGRELTLKDNLTQRAESGGPEAVRQASRAPSYKSVRSDVRLDDERFEDRARAIRDALGGAIPEPSSDRWFTRTLDEELGVIAYLNQLLHGGALEDAILVDPFFGESALQRFLLRLGSTDLKLTIVTSWGATHPDTAERLPADQGLSVDQNVKRLSALMDRLHGLIAPSIVLRNVVRGAGGQAFHDRYLLLHAKEGGPRVFLLSNSVNAMAASWPFCMSELSGAASQRAREYIEGLARGEDITSVGEISTNFLWPNP